VERGPVTELIPLTEFEPLELGEGPVWNSRRQELSVVDIFQHKIHRFRLEGSQFVTVNSIDVASDVGAALPLVDGGFVTCQRDGIVLVNEAGDSSTVCPLPAGGPTMRANDAKLGPDGALWVGVMDNDATPGEGSLWRVWRDGFSECLLADLTIPNGLDWWDKEFWFVDGPREELTCYEWDGHKLGPPKRVLRTNGTPDGLAIGADGTLCLALWGEGRIDAINPDGTLRESFDVPAPHSTSLTFIGPTLESIAVTTAHFALGDGKRKEFPNSGHIFVGQSVARGREQHHVWSEKA